MHRGKRPPGPAAPCPVPLPRGFRVRVRPDVAAFEGGTVLAGGSPPTVLRLVGDAAEVALTPGEVFTVEDAITVEVADRLLATNLADPELDDPTKAVVPADLAELTVVIPAYNSAASLDRTLATLGRGGLPPVIVVDDCSTDDGATAAVAERHGARLLRHDRNRGPAAARNTGLREVRTPYVAFVDADVQVTPDELRRLLEHMADPGLALVAPRLRGRIVSERSRWFERFDSEHSGLDRGVLPAQVSDAAEVSWLPGACLVCRVAALGPGFDEGLRTGEDVDLVWRLVDAGARVRYAPDIVAWHDTRVRPDRWLARKMAYGASMAPLSHRHPGRIAVAAFSGPQVVVAAALALPGWWTIPAVAAATGLTARRVARVLPEGERTGGSAWYMAARALAHTAGQVSDLMLRHWWPVLVVGAPFSACLRRAVTLSLAIDFVRRSQDENRAVGLGTFLAGARLDDLAFGFGLWAGAWRGRTLRPLLPRLSSERAAR